MLITEPLKDPNDILVKYQKRVDHRIFRSHSTLRRRYSHSRSPRVSSQKSCTTYVLILKGHSFQSPPSPLPKSSSLAPLKCDPFQSLTAQLFATSSWTLHLAIFGKKIFAIAPSSSPLLYFPFTPRFLCLPYLRPYQRVFQFYLCTLSLVPHTAENNLLFYFLAPSYA